LAGKDHREGDDAVEADLPRLVDHAHAAPGNLLDQLVIAEVPHLDPFSRGQFPTGLRRYW
jgi:hypothetical protein